eukprot:c44451_g1_i1 orf=79-288(+)
MENPSVEKKAAKDDLENLNNDGDHELHIPSNDTPPTEESKGPASNTQISTCPERGFADLDQKGEDRQVR